MASTTKLPPIQCVIAFEYDGGENHDPDGVLRQAKKVVEDGGGWVEVDFRHWPGFG